MKYKLSNINCQLSIIPLFRYSVILSIALLSAMPIKAQVNVGSEDAPKPFSILELTAKIKQGGLRLPQLSNVDRDKLNTTGIDAAQGLVIFNTDNDCVEFWNGAKWIDLCADNIDYKTLTIGGAVTAYTNVMYDFQHQTLEAYSTGSGAPTGYQWQVGVSADGDFNDIPGANANLYTVPAHFADSYGVDSLFFRCILSYPDSYVKTPNDFNIYFIRTETADGTPTGNYGIANGVRYLTIQKGGDLSGIKIALLNLGQSRNFDGSYNNDAGDLGDFYQWGRAADGYQKSAWSKDAAHVNTILPTSGSANATSAVVPFNNGGKTPAYDGNGQVLNNGSGHYGNYINASSAPADGENDWYYNGGSHNGSLWGNGSNPTTRASDILLSSWTYTSNNPCPSGWRLPSAWNFWDIYDGTGADTTFPISSNYVGAVNSWRWRGTYNNAVGGAIIANATGEKVFMPAIGYRSTINNNMGTSGDYWGSSVSNTVTPGMSWWFYFSSSNVLCNVSASRTLGTVVRCVADNSSIPTPTLEVDPTSLNFDYNATASQSIIVTTNQPSWTWSISGTNAADFTVTPSGNTLIVLPKTNNSDATQRTATISVIASGLTEPISVTQDIDITNAPNTPVAANTYVGAFWRANQSGERIIRIPNVTNAGAWSAFVMLYDNQWDASNGDGILFSTSGLDAAGLSARNISWTSTTTPADAETFKLTDGTPTVSGMVAANGTIQFRIGLQKPFDAYKPDTDPNPNPARYAVVLLSYANNTQAQRIYIRQGEGADYLMRNIDTVSTGNLTSRTKCVKFSPYNTTYSTMNSQVPYNNGTFTDYPSQAGAIFQWANDNVPRYAFDPYASSPGITSWQNNFPNTFWDVLSGNNETCPSGYRRPTDGTTSASDTGPTMTSSEMRQSLYLNPQTGEGSNIDNSVWGYYADGFFDRRQIRTIGTGSPSSVLINDNQIAHIGRLFYNPTTNASLFFPAAGYRNSSDGVLNSPGTIGNYWSSSSYSSNLSWFMGFDYRSVSQTRNMGNRSYGENVRCVAR